MSLDHVSKILNYNLSLFVQIPSTPNHLVGGWGRKHARRTGIKVRSLQARTNII